MLCSSIPFQCRPCKPLLDLSRKRKLRFSKLITYLRPSWGQGFPTASQTCQPPRGRLGGGGKARSAPGGGYRKVMAALNMHNSWLLITLARRPRTKPLPANLAGDPMRSCCSLAASWHLGSGLQHRINY